MTFASKSFVTLLLGTEWKTILALILREYLLEVYIVSVSLAQVLDLGSLSEDGVPPGSLGSLCREVFIPLFTTALFRALSSCVPGWLLPSYVVWIYHPFRSHPLRGI